MKPSGLFWFGLLLLATVSISGCELPLDSIFGEGAVTPEAVGTIGAPSSAAAPVVSRGGLATDYMSLTGTLKAAGVTVEPSSEEAGEPFFSVKGRVIKVNGKDVLVFEYATEATADAEAAQISPDGSTIGTMMVTWVAPPHFFKAGRVIAFYAGSDKLVLKALTAALGPEFAGA